MRIPPFRLVLWPVLAASVIIAHRTSGYVWLAGVVSVLVGAALCARRRAAQTDQSSQSPTSGSLDRVITGYRRLQIGVARWVGRHPWITASVLFAAMAIATALPWRRGVPNLGLNPWHDCESNLLAARLIAEGRLARPALQQPAFFRTVHVLVTPFYASKYPPGYPAVMAAGLWAGHVEWVPPILVGMAVATAWLLGRRVLGRWSALLAALVLATCPIVIQLGMLQLSNTLSLLLGVWVVGLWCGQVRGRSPGRGWVIGLLLACMFLTRSFDAVALGVVLVVAQLATGSVRNAATWRWLAGVCLGGLPGVVGLLATHHATTGDWKESPYMVYERQQSYTGQFLHEAMTPPPDLDALPVNVRRVAEEFVLPAQRAHTLAHLPVAIGERFADLSRYLGDAMLLLPLAALPVAWRCRAARPLLGLCAGYFALYLVYAFNHWRYMAPILPGLAWAMLAGLEGIRPPRVRRLLEMLLVLLLATGAFSILNLLANHKLDETTRRFHLALGSLPAGRKLVFVRYAPDHWYHREFVFNEPDLERAETIFAHDLGDDRNAGLIAAYPDRRVFNYDEAAREVRPYRPSRPPPPDPGLPDP